MAVIPDTQQIISIANRKAGLLPSPAVPWPAAVVALGIRMDSTTMTDPTVTVTMTLEESRDNEATWLFMTSITTQCGGVDKQGNPINPGFYFQLDEHEIGMARKVRGSIDVSKAGRWGLLADIYTQNAT